MRHNPRCAIFREPPGLRSDEDCNCGAIPPLPARLESVDSRTLAKHILSLADTAGMPDSFWATDHRIVDARRVLGIGPDQRYTHHRLWSGRTTPSPLWDN